jgi:spore germination protein GerM
MRCQRALATGVVVAIALVLLAGCGVPVDRSPSALPRKDVPFGLLRPSAPSTTTTTKPSPVEIPVSIFLVASSGHLEAVAREVPAAQDSLVGVLGVLVRGPSNAETLAGFQSAVPAQTTVLGAVVGPGGLATVNLGGSTFGQLVGQAQIQAVAQIVFTATALPGVTDVAFELAGQAVDVPVASGAQVPEANRSQFAELAPLPVTSTSG